MSNSGAVVSVLFSLYWFALKHFTFDCNALFILRMVFWDKQRSVTFCFTNGNWSTYEVQLFKCTWGNSSTTYILKTRLADIFGHRHLGLIQRWNICCLIFAEITEGTCTGTKVCQDVSCIAIDKEIVKVPSPN